MSLLLSRFGVCPLFRVLSIEVFVEDGGQLRFSDSGARAWFGSIAGVVVTRAAMGRGPIIKVICSCRIFARMGQCPHVLYARWLEGRTWCIIGGWSVEVSGN